VSWQKKKKSSVNPKKQPLTNPQTQLLQLFQQGTVAPGDGTKRTWQVVAGGVSVVVSC